MNAVAEHFDGKRASSYSVVGKNAYVRNGDCVEKQRNTSDLSCRNFKTTNSFFRCSVHFCTLFTERPSRRTYAPHERSRRGEEPRRTIVCFVVNNSATGDY